MNSITIGEIEKATDGKLLYGNREDCISNICTDSRKATNGGLFVPIIGETHDGHKFIPQAIGMGCSGVISSEPEAVAAYESCNVIIVQDTVKAMQKLAGYYLEKLNLKKVAVTGSVGKTTTRDMVYHILSEKYNTGKTYGNFNNDIGVPLTIFSFDDTMEAAVLETGMDHFGEIHRLVEIIKPDIGIITNIGVSHIEHLGSRQGILKAKMEITDLFNEENTLVVNQSNDILSSTEFTGNYNVVKVGTDPGDEYYIHNIKSRGEKGITYLLNYKDKEYSVQLNVPGQHNAINGTLAIAAGKALGVSINDAINGLKKLQLTGKRLTIREAGNLKIIDDTYNAAPDSMKSALQTLEDTEGERKIAILGGMNELGEKSEDYHYEVGLFAGNSKLDYLITIGGKAEKISQGGLKLLKKDQVMHFNTKEEFYEKMKGLLKPGDVILVKASRSMEMEQIVERIINEQE